MWARSTCLYPSADVEPVRADDDRPYWERPAWSPLQTALVFVLSVPPTVTLPLHILLPTRLTLLAST